MEKLKELLKNKEKIRNPQMIIKFRNAFNKEYPGSFPKSQYDISNTLTILITKIHEHYHNKINYFCPSCSTFLISGTLLQQQLSVENAININMIYIENYLNPTIEEKLQDDILSYIFQDNLMMPIEYYLPKPPHVLYYVIQYTEVNGYDNIEYEKMVKSYLENNETITYEYQNIQHYYVLSNLVFHSCINKDKFYYAYNENQEISNYAIKSFGEFQQQLSYEFQCAVGMERDSNIPIQHLMDHIHEIKNENKEYSPKVLLYMLNK